MIKALLGIYGSVIALTSLGWVFAIWEYSLPVTIAVSIGIVSVILVFVGVIMVNLTGGDK